MSITVSHCSNIFFPFSSFSSGIKVSLLLCSLLQLYDFHLSKHQFSPIMRRNMTYKISMKQNTSACFGKLIYWRGVFNCTPSSLYNIRISNIISIFNIEVKLLIYLIRLNSMKHDIIANMNHLNPINFSNFQCIHNISVHIVVRCDD